MKKQQIPEAKAPAPQRSIDEELDALKLIVKAIDYMPEEERYRAMKYIKSKYNMYFPSDNY